MKKPAHSGLPGVRYSRLDQLLPPVTIKNTAAKNAMATIKHMVRNGTFDAKVFRMLLDRGLFWYGSIGRDGCR
jgi:hypothetical protein